jgi:hypothetical protein
MHRIALHAALVCTLWSVVRTWPATTPFSVRGEMVRTVYSSEQNEELKEVWHFDFYGAGESWAAYAEPEDSHHPFELSVTAGDGTNITRLDRAREVITGVESPILQHTLVALLPGGVMSNVIKGSTLSNGNSRVVMSIYSGSIPRLDQALGALLWLGFGSGPYFGAQGTNVVTAPSVWEAASVPESVMAIGRLIAGSPGLPEHLVFGPHSSSSNAVVMRSLREGGGASKYASAEYSITGVTNTGELSLPLGFTFLKFYHGRASTNADGSRKLRSTLRCSVQGVITGQAATPDLPKPEPGYTLVEKRLPSSSLLPFFRYLADSDSWKPLSEVTNMPRFQKRVRNAEFLLKRGKTRHMAFWIAVAVISLGFPACIYYFQSQRG